ncbi:MAG: PEGA domain-containing protein [Deltaproteobacteria bacterium]|nr:PEGA domain-containing protein [Deltaproteobacteria bacterium]
MSISNAVVGLLAVCAAGGDTGVAPRRVVLLPPPADSGVEARLLFDAVAAGLRESVTLALVPDDQFRGLSKPTKRPDDLRVELDSALRRVREAYRRLDIDEATRTLQSLENARLSMLACPENIEFASQLSLWLGVMYAASRDGAHASERFRTALFIDPLRTIDTTYFPPQTVALFEKIRGNLEAMPTGGLSLSSDPEAAHVFLDGEDMGTEPLTLNAAEGDHFLCVRRLGSRDWAARVRVTAGKVETQRIYLQNASPQETAGQIVALLAGAQAIDLHNSTHVRALGAALGADILATPRLPATLIFRLVREPSRERRLEGRAGLAGPEEIAGNLVGMLEQDLAVDLERGAPPGPASPTPTSRRKLALELGLGGAYLPPSGGSAGISLGASYLLAPSVAVAVSAGGSWPAARVNLNDPVIPAKNALGSAGESYELGAELGLRWEPIGTERLRMLVALSARLCHVQAGAPQDENADLVEPRTPFSVTYLGPRVGMGAAFALSARIDLLALASYALEARLSGSSANVWVGLNRVVPIYADATRHEVGLALAMAVHFL